MMLRKGRWKLVNDSGFGREIEMERIEPEFELYDLRLDPYEQQNRAADHPDIVERLKGFYDAWYEDVGADDPANYDPPRIVVGAPEAPTVTLTRQDWRRDPEDGGWGNGGQWLIDVVEPGPYTVRIVMRDEGPHGLILRCSDIAWPADIPEGEREITLEDVALSPGETSITARSLDAAAYQIIISR